MPEYFGIDTSNYTTSAAIYSSETNEIIQCKKLLPVKEGALGLRQSDAVFHHTKQLPEIIEELFNCRERNKFSAVAASVRPRNIDGSYMPCFLCGEGFIRSYSAINGLPMYRTSHQIGHILAALYSADKLDYIKEPFIAFHISGGTTDCLYCEPDADDILKITEISTSLDLKAGQLIDRVGLMLDLKFPCGAQLENLAVKSDLSPKFKISLKDGNCCLSGVENICKNMKEHGDASEDIAKFCLEYISSVILAMTGNASETKGNLPIIYAGGVMSDKLIRDRILKTYSDASFAEPQFSCDNAAGIAIYAYLKNRSENKCL